ncbi:MAG: ABC transporter permease [Hyphomicrobium sp.]|uniref:ABC transporter permease n=1 Tax=Hyphomicrobium sp. TaxID=82 RepID=UPI003D0CD207
MSAVLALPPARSPRLWRRLPPLALAGAVLLILFGLLVLAAPLVAAALGTTPDAVDLLQRLAPPSTAHPLGTDALGRDTLLRLLEGGRVSLGLGLSVALLAAVIGTAVGLWAGYAGGFWDQLLMRTTDGVIALPLLPLLIVLAAIDPAKLGIPPEAAASPLLGIGRIGLLIALVGWTTVARLVRGATLSLKEREFVRAARALGAGPVRILLRHILPNLVRPLIVAATLSVGNIILLESVLSFLGLGVMPPAPSWGNMLTGAEELIWSAPLQAVWPGLAIFLTVIACNLLGDGLQEALDPQGHRR